MPVNRRYSITLAGDDYDTVSCALPSASQVIVIMFPDLLCLQGESLVQSAWFSYLRHRFLQMLYRSELLNMAGSEYAGVRSSPEDKSCQGGVLQVAVCFGS